MSPASGHESETGHDQFSDLETKSEPDQTPTHLTPEQLELWFKLTEWIINAEGPPYHEKLGVAPEVRYEVAKTLCDKGEVENRNPTIEYNPIKHRLSIRMCSNPRTSLSRWVVNGRYDAIESGFFTWDESKEHFFMFNVAIYKFSAPYEKASKDGGGYILRGGIRFPCIAFESGHESWSNLLEVKDMWLQGGAPCVNAVVLLKWDERDNGEVADSLELHRRDGIACPRIDVFPVPSPGTLHAAQTVNFYRRDFYPEGKVPGGRDPNDVWNWEIDKLRGKATWTM